MNLLKVIWHRQRAHAASLDSKPVFETITLQWSMASLQLLRLLTPILCYHNGLVGKESACSGGDQSSVLGLGKSPGEGNGNPLQYFCLENSRDRGAWRAIVHGVAKSWTQLRQLPLPLPYYQTLPCINYSIKKYPNVSQCSFPNPKLHCHIKLLLQFKYTIISWLKS